MALFLSTDDVRELATADLVMDAARSAVNAEREGRAVIPPRLDVNLPRGFLRVMPGALDGLMGLKVMTLVRGVGNRYLLLVYTQETGELLAMLDADEVTRLRTAGITAVAAHVLQPEPQRRIALIGSGFEATTHLRAMARLWPLESVAVYSPSVERRTAFAERQTLELGIDVKPVCSAAKAIGTARTVVLATKASEPVIDGRDLQPDSVVLSIGSTRPDLRELDRSTLRRAAVVMVDDAASVLRECGDLIDAIAHGAVTPDHLVSIAGVMSAPETLERSGERDLRVFKSAGTAVQDLALAGRLLTAATTRGVGRELGELTRLKPATAPVQLEGEVA
ncbi:MAG: ornithine cyclodeaminase family protein [Solirubrobacterales bacterium]|nr:ornithine cyclodeaminase family protein [Solirubrobacterales bacterium]